MTKHDLCAGMIVETPNGTGEVIHIFEREMSKPIRVQILSNGIKESYSMEELKIAEII